MGNTQPTPPQNQKQNHEEPDPNPSSTTLTCEICIEPISLPSQKFKNGTNCTHPFCLDCVTKYIAVRLQDHNASIINCPALDCDKTLDPLTCRPLIPRQLFDKWCDVLCDTSLLELDRCYCPNRECSALVVNECGGSVKKSKCPNCKKLFCFKCKTSWHAGYRCEETGEMRDGNDVAFGVLVETRKWMRCPRCQHFVELIDGCSIVKCRCGTSFCYKCGKNVSQHWCDCHGPPMGCIWLFRICLLLLIFFPLVFLYLGSVWRDNSKA
ncbi:hypothetical protein LguiB_022293 [Lonicera macranthoides]